MLYDDQAIYISITAAQAHTPISATQTQDDVGFGIDDFVGIGLDPSGNGDRVYYFEVNPIGTHFAQSSEDSRYRPRWASSAVRNNGGWSAFMRIPLRVLRLPNDSPQRWKINVIRFVAATAQRESWAYDGLMNDGQGGPWPDFGAARFWPSWTNIELHGSAPRPRPQFDLYSLASFGSDRNQFLQANGAFSAQSVRPAGIDVTVPVASTINFVGTLAPDFSNVEIDQQTIAPQEFRRNLQEYRPFFAQGAAFINSNPYSGNAPIFYSPGVGSFDRGTKIEGTFGKQAFGALNFRGYDPSSGNVFDDTAFGFKHALADRTFLLWTDGVLAHHSLAGSDTTIEVGTGGRNNRTGFVWSVDHALEHGTWVPNGIAHSTTGFIDVHRTNYEINVSALDISPTYNPLDGFTQVTDQRGFTGFAFLSGAPFGLKHASLFLNADRFFDQSGAVHQADFDPALVVAFRNGFSIDGLGPSIGNLRFYDTPSGPQCSGPSLGASAFSGYPCYRNGTSQYFNLMTLPIGFREGTPSPADATASWGIFGATYLHQYDLTHTRQLGAITLNFEYAGTYERAIASGILDSQWLRRIGFGYNINPTSTFSIALRSVNGLGGFVGTPGTNLSMSYHKRFLRGDLFMNYGTPAASNTLHRFILKYIFHIGSGSGT